MDFRSFILISLAIPLAAFADSPEVLVNPQGLAQQDLSIRGSSYTGSGSSINGHNLKVPYSAHFNSELPVLDKILSSGDVHHGLDNVSGHLIGTAAYHTQPLKVTSEVSAAIGTKEHYQASTFGSSENIGGFIDWEKVRKVDYDANDLERLSAGAFVQFVHNDWLFDILTASQTKEFDAQGYYGVLSTVYAEERTDDGLLFASASKGDLDDAFFRASASYREFDDQYRIPSSAFANDVLSRYGSAVLEGRTLEIQHLVLNLRGDLEHERVSGDISSHDRTRGSILIMPEARFEKVVLKAGLNSIFQTSESAEWLPSAGIDWLATDNSSIYASYTETVQKPDYQTLYYTDPFRAGNAGLGQQKSQNTELGFHQFLSASLDWRIAGFFRQVENTMDWTQAAANGIWTATDLGTLNMGGIDIAVNYNASEKLQLRAYYQWLEKESVDVYAGLYELDYPDHLLNLSAYWKFLKEFAVEFAQTTRYQTSNKVRTSSDFGASASLGLHYFPRYANNVRLSFLVDNLWGTNFQAIPGLKPRPTTVATGIAVTW